MSASGKDLVNRYYRAINDADWDAYDDLFTPDASLEAPGGVTGTGPAEIRAFDQIFKQACPDFTVTPLLQTQNGEAVLSENTAEGTQTETLSLPGGDIAPTGHRLYSKYVGVFEVRDGRLSAQRIYFDRMVLVEQLGVPGAPVAASTSAG